MSQAFQENLFQHVLESLPEQEFYSREALNNPVIPADIGHFLSQALVRRASLEAGDLITRESPWIDFDAPSADAAISTFVSSLSESARYPRGAFKASLSRAIHFCSTFRSRPLATLLAFAFSEDENQNDIADLRRRAGYFLYHAPVLQTFERYLTGLDDTVPSKSGAQELLHSNAEEHGQSLDADGWMRHFEPIFSLFGLMDPDVKDYPAEPILDLVEEFSADALARTLDALFSQSGGRLGRDQLANALNHFFQPPEPQSERKSGGVNAGADLPLWKQFAQPEAHSTESPIADSAATRKAEPLWKSYQKGAEPAAALAPAVAAEAASTVAAPSASAPSASTPSVSAPSVSAPSASTPSVSAPSNAASAANVIPRQNDRLESAVLGEATRHRDRFVSELFKGSESAYDQTLQQLSAASTWQDASQILSTEVFRKFHVDIYSDTAVLFTNAVERQIAQQS